MNTRLRIVSLSSALAFAALLCACGTFKHPSPSAAMFDLGPLPATSASSGRLPAVSIAEVRSPSWLDSTFIHYRLAYADSQQPRPYAESRWAAPPSVLIGQRLKARIAQAGGIALSAADGASNVPTLHIEADDFTQVFSSPSQSVARIALRASLFEGRTLIAQKTFINEAPAQSADAAGGAHAFAVASDAVIGEILSWLSTIPVKASASR